MNFTTIQKEHRKWSLKNFPNQQAHHCLLGMIEEVGELAHAHLKMEQGIRMNEDHLAGRADAIADTVLYLIGHCNYHGVDIGEAGNVKFEWDLLSSILSLPRLVHKLCVGGTDNIKEHAIALISELNLIAYNTGVDFEKNLIDTWAKVKQRDWTQTCI